MKQMAASILALVVLAGCVDSETNNTQQAETQQLATVKKASIEKIATLPIGKTAYVSAITFNTDGSKLFVAESSNDVNIKVWDTKNYKQPLSIINNAFPSLKYSWKLAWTPDGKQIFGLSAEDRVQLVKLSSDDKSISATKSTKSLADDNAIAISPDGTQMALGTDDALLALFTQDAFPKTLSQIFYNYDRDKEERTYHTKYFLYDASDIGEFTKENETELREYYEDSPRWSLLDDLIPLREEITGEDIYRSDYDSKTDEEILEEIIKSNKERITNIKKELAQELSRYVQGAGGTVNGLRFSGDGLRLFVATNDYSNKGSVQVWDVKNRTRLALLGQEKWTKDKNPADGQDTKFLSDGVEMNDVAARPVDELLLAAVGKGDTVALWSWSGKKNGKDNWKPQWRTPKQVDSYFKPAPKALRVVWSPDGNMFAVGYNNATWKLWQVSKSRSFPSFTTSFKATEILSHTEAKATDDWNNRIKHIAWGPKNTIAVVVPEGNIEIYEVKQ